MIRFTLSTRAGTLACALAIAPWAVMAHDGPKSNAGYVSDSRGHIATDGQGNCLRTSAWTPALAIPSCEPGMIKAQAPVPDKSPSTLGPTPVATKPAAPVPAPQPDVEKVTLRGEALFDSGRAELKPRGADELRALAAQRKALQSVETIRIVGYTDSTGPMPLNESLSQQRAQVVRDYLIQQGLNPARIEAIGMGPSNPVASNDTREGRALNRRVEVEIRALREVDEN